jgi:hypothetical protein
MMLQAVSAQRQSALEAVERRQQQSNLRGQAGRTTEQKRDLARANIRTFDRTEDTESWAAVGARVASAPESSEPAAGVDYSDQPMRSESAESVMSNGSSVDDDERSEISLIVELAVREMIEAATYAHAASGHIVIARMFPHARAP